MAAGSQRAILLFAGLLLLASIILVSLDENSSNNVIFVVIISTSMIILLWKIFSSQTKNQRQDFTSSTKLEEFSPNRNPKVNTIIIENEIPDPLEKEIDIPLM